MPPSFSQPHPAGRARPAIALLLIALVLAALFPVAPARAQEGGLASAVIVADGRVNVRSGPGAGFAVLGKLQPGDSVTVLARNEAGDWLHVRAALAGGPAAEGWVAAALVSMNAAAGSFPAAAEAGAGTESPFARAVQRRAADAPDARPAAKAAPAPAEVAGVEAPVQAAAGAGAESSAGGGEPENAPSSAPVAVTQPASMNLRGGPGTNYPTIGAVPAGTRLEITGLSPAGDWYRVAGGDFGEQAWVFGALVTAAGALESIARLGEEEIPAPPAPAPAEAAAPAPVAAAPSAPVAAAMPAPAPSGGGGFGYGITAQMWQSDKGSVAAAVQDLGFAWVKQQVRWEFVETAPGAVNWQEMDGIVNTMNGYGINVAFSVVTAPEWTRPTKGGTNGPPEDFQRLADFLGAVAGRYCGQSLKAIEVWNEQNLQREWEGFPLDPALYMDLLKRAYASIKAACPAMIVISGATTPAGYSDVAFDDIDYLRGMYANGLARYSDAVGIHPSGFGNPPSVRFGDWASGGYDAPSHVNHRSFYFLSTLEESRGVMVQFGDAGKRLWPTEFGWGSTVAPHPGYEYEGRIGEGQQAQWIADAYRIMANSGYVGVAFLWNLNYDYGEMAAFAVAGRPAYAALKGLTGR